MEEIWKDIAGYEGLYQVSNLGRVKSLDKYIPFNGTISLRKGKILKQKTNKYGYKCLRLFKNGCGKWLIAHRIVAQAFIPNPNNLPQVNHKDENKSNNLVENLEWCDAKYNMNYGTRIERTSKKEINRPDKSRPVLQYTLCNEFVAEYKSINEAERQTGINQSNISACCRNKKIKDGKGSFYTVKSAGGFIWKYK